MCLLSSRIYFILIKIRLCVHACKHVCRKVDAFHIDSQWVYCLVGCVHADACVRELLDIYHIDSQWVYCIVENSFCQFCFINILWSRQLSIRFLSDVYLGTPFSHVNSLLSKLVLWLAVWLLVLEFAFQDKFWLSIQWFKSVYTHVRWRFFDAIDLTIDLALQTKGDCS